MKKIFVLLFIFLFLSFITNSITTLADSPHLMQGIYTLENLNLKPDTSYNIQNISSNEPVYILISDSNQIVHQSIQLEPSSQKYNLQPLRNDYVLSIIGKGEVIIS